MSRQDYLDRQRQFWDVADATERKFNRVDTLYGGDRTDASFDAAADERVRWILDGLTLPDEPHILEIGCGIGAVLERLRAAIPSATLWGVDIAAAMITDASERFRNDPRMTLRVTAGDGVPDIPDESIDLVICTGVFIHILDIEVIQNYIREARRVLRPAAAFRFNARYWRPDLAYGASVGGRLARWLHKIGWYSALKSTSKTTAQADFNGLHFTLAELDLLVRRNGLVAEAFLPMMNGPDDPSGYIRVNCRRPA